MKGNKGNRAVTYNKNNPQGQFKQETAKELNVTTNRVGKMDKDALTKTEQASEIAPKKSKDTMFTG